ncbi:FAD binding domain-containing protein [Petropleomorpha daqingensis]|uniref:Carbon-monoxide dehydrogenase medium subunit n=1 Tax=Petropleomorpha daqingensis TaxID=2026353 RepID=A0A853CCH5_9ACTN|nr:FAD binding domain-containing protein [Petropleomorpha daqingensis]NYJ04108.1 carbon-monoxide dehydrogenase medium subunit [Petropleomorpha daqingensis]
MPKYVRPATRAEALAALAEGGAAARPLVGGTDLLVGLRHHTVEPDVLVDLKGVTDLPEPIVVTDDAVRIGATYTLGELVAHPVVQESYPALVEAALTVGSVAIRNRASLIANSCNASPAADTAPPLLVHGASVTIASADGDRTATLDEFFLGPRRTLCGPGELVVRLDLPRPAAGSGSAFRRLTRRRGVDLATVSVAALVDADGAIVLGMGAVGPRPLLTRTGPVDLADDAALDAALDELLAPATPISDVRGSREYRLAMLRVLAKRAVLAAADRRTPEEMAS